ncbi:hypothetical protein [Aquimarina rubra]|uniref:Uncharacterized protein n=1 Tax=Aquimarina rubra TaxID=1920033 RepID=A0ABW5LCP4_9FLAO
MKFNKEINLFELTEKVVNRFRSESQLELTGYEFEFKIKRDWNCPVNRININLFIFGEDYAQTVFDEKYNTLDKVIDLLFVHLRDDAGFDNLKDGLIMANRHKIESRTENLTERINLLSKELLELNGLKPIIVNVDEKYPFDSLYENGFPIVQYQIYTPGNEIKLYFDLDFNLRGFQENEVFEIVNKEIKKHLTLYNKT